MAKKKTNKRTRPLSQVSSRARARAKITAEALRQREGASSLEHIGNQLELPSWVQGLVLPAIKDLKLGSIKDMRLQENARLDNLLLALSEHALANGDLMAIDRHLKISKARRELWRLHREAGEAEPDQNVIVMTPEQMIQRMKEVRRRDGILVNPDTGKRIFPSEE